MQANVNPKWWKESVIYEIYPKSFMDSNGDGVGDLAGIVSKLDYLRELGVNVLWLTPIYGSPDQEGGYDISDHRAIMDKFGTLDDFDRLLGEAHERGMKIMLEMPLNHTSDRHAWFEESRASKQNDKRNYYIWREGRGSGYPNNWGSYFGGSVWEFDQDTEEYYMHLYGKKQPNLNWENERLREELYQVVKFWADKGVDGFHFNSIAHIVKTEGHQDNDDDNPQHLPVERAYQMFSSLEKVNAIANRLHKESGEEYDIVVVGEAAGLDPAQTLDCIGDEPGKANIVMNSDHMLLTHSSQGIGRWTNKSWTLLDLKKAVSHWQTVLHEQGWNANYLADHDQPRGVCRFGHTGEYRELSAKMLATFLMTLQGTPSIYQGEELGMIGGGFHTEEDFRDVETLNYLAFAKRTGIDPEEALKVARRNTRDAGRTPMQWDASANAGFTTGEPWIGLAPGHEEVNAEAAVADPNSIYHYYRKLIELRKVSPTLLYGEYKLLLPLDTDIYAYTRTFEDETLLVILNFFAGTPHFNCPERLCERPRELLLGNYEPGEVEGHSFELRPYEAAVYRLG
ncbi:alpha-glucosidase [Saccharibacillus sp. CPCC 101409]|uniref:glycoside hydrolase family 13 protein n=1 Tax=Saccharibacillus sp. CPCC 101409 TaxID=3058041 RepID=UPI002670D1AC|nr:alpha-glucosidase [Saccharibacillus sp. CPCC 101409]MDO3412709.1 alpha-glucosidase [Saccharibacillus sp. CPCC 101409]